MSKPDQVSEPSRTPRGARFGRLSNPGYTALLGALGAFLAAAVVLALGVGSASISPAQVVSALWSAEPGVTQQIVWEIRLPRVLGAALVGGALAVVGAGLQSVMKNPLADPYILGISSGASIGAAFSALIGDAALLMPVLAFGAALASVWVVYRIALVDGRVPPVRLLLAGVALSSFGTSVTSFILYLVPEATHVRGVIFWLLGGLSGADWSSLVITTAIAVPVIALFFATARWQTILLLGDESALSLGLDVSRARRFLIVISALLVGAVVAFAGAIGFVGLIIPHMLRPLTGPDHRRLLPAVLLAGALLLLGMDTLARVVMAPQELPVGILSGLLGAPFFLMLLRNFRESSHG